jgi:hypothetical protein
MICTYNAQDACDAKDYEGEYNDLVVDLDTQKTFGVESAVEEKRRHGKTDRKNYAFWFKKDVEKIIGVVHNNGVLPVNFPSDFNYHYWPDFNLVNNLLRETKGEFLFYDCETDANLNITVFSFSYGYPDVYIVPLLDWNYNRAYAKMGEMLTSLAICIRDNTIVAHNGMGFDFYILGHRYRIPVRKCYDTMLAQNRIYPEVEKSLGHALSLPWIYEVYHKDEGCFNFHNEQQMRQNAMYCGKDVSSLVRLKRAQDEYAKKHLGLRSSIDSVNSYIRPYLTTTLLGIRYDKKALDANIEENDKKCNAYLRMVEILVGRDNLRKIRGTGKGTICSSSIQAVKYFHDMLNYPVVLRSKKTGRPSLSAKAIYKLKLVLATYCEKFGGIINPVLDIIIAYRQIAKETGTLKFIPWKE